MSRLGSLADDLLGEILQYADRASLAAVPVCSSALRASVEGHALLWNQLLERDWNLQEQQEEEKEKEKEEAAAEEEDAQPRQRYIQLCTLFGRTTPHYQRVSGVWKRIESWLDSHAASLPPIRATLRCSPALAQLTEPSSAAGNESPSALPPPLPSSITQLDALVASQQREWHEFQRTLRRRIAKEEKLEAGLAEAEQKRMNKRDAARDRNSSSRGATASSSPSASASSSSASAAAGTSSSDSDGTMEFEAAIGLPPRDPAPDAHDDDESHPQLPFFDFKVPSELLCSALLHDGQTEVLTREHLFTGLFGGFSFYSFVTNLRLLPLVDMLQEGLVQAKSAAERKYHELRNKRKANKRRKSMSAATTGSAAAASSSSSSTEMSDVTPTVSSLLAPPVPPSSSPLDSDPFHALPFFLPLTSSPIGPEEVCFFLDCATGNVVRKLQDETLHVVADSFLAFLEKHASSLEQGVYGFDARTGINRFPLRGDPCGSDTVTQGIRIQVSVLFVPEQSVQGQFFFTYHVRITHAEGGEGVPLTRATLTTRHWEIVEEDGKINRVDGPGVIGFYPTIFSGCPLFTYESCSPISTPRGVMRGSFRFRDAASQEEFDALIQPFVFDIDRNYC